MLQELEELMELDPKRLSEEDLDDRRKEVVEVNLRVLLSALFHLWLHRLYHLTFKFKINKSNYDRITYNRKGERHDMHERGKE